MTFQKGQSGNPDTQFKPGQSGNPSGPKPGYKHISTHIQNMLNEEVFDPETQLKRVPLEVIIKTALIKAEAGDKDSREWLAKYGYGQKFEFEHSGEIATGVNDPQLAADFAEFTKQQSKE